MKAPAAQQMIQNRTFDEIQVGDFAQLVRTLRPEDIHLFAAMSGDVNPTHVDLEYARTRGERPANLEKIVQGTEAMRRAAILHPEVQLLRFEIGNLVKPDSAARSGPAARLVAREIGRAGRRARER